MNTKNDSEYEIILGKNKDFLRNILTLKLGDNINKYENEEYFIITKKNVLFGISRITLLTSKEKLKENIKIFNIFNRDKVFMLSGIWIDPSIRNNGFGKRLIGERMSITNFKDTVISDVENKSPLIKYYKEELNMKIQEEDEYYSYLKRN